MRLTRQHYEFFADEIAPMLPWATGIQELADKLKHTNPRFDRDKFVRRATQNWEAKYQSSLEEINDDIPS
jgi:hypothetical protein